MKKERLLELAGIVEATYARDDTPDLPRDLLKAVVEEGLVGQFASWSGDLYDHGWEDEKYQEAIDQVDFEELIKWACKQTLKNL
jgi:hypothetical protein